MIFDEPGELPSSVVEIFYARHGADIIMQTNYASRDINGCNHVYLHEFPCLVAQSIFMYTWTTDTQRELFFKNLKLLGFGSK